MYPLALFVDSDRRRFCEYERCVDLLRSLLAPPMAHGDSEDNHLWGERLEEKGDTYQLDSLGVLGEGGMSGLGLNAEQAPDIGKCIGER